jgi:hypothetical protein
MAGDRMAGDSDIDTMASNSDTMASDSDTIASGDED